MSNCVSIWSNECICTTFCFCRVNPITGRWEEDKPDPMAGMTEEQKEYEAMQLVNKLDKLSRWEFIKQFLIEACFAFIYLQLSYLLTKLKSPVLSSVRLYDMKLYNLIYYRKVTSFILTLSSRCGTLIITFTKSVSKFWMIIHFLSYHSYILSS